MGSEMCIRDRPTPDQAAGIGGTPVTVRRIPVAVAGAQEPVAIFEFAAQKRVAANSTLPQILTDDGELLDTFGEEVGDRFLSKPCEVGQEEPQGSKNFAISISSSSPLQTRGTIDLTFSSTPQEMSPPSSPVSYTHLTLPTIYSV